MCQFTNNNISCYNYNDMVIDGEGKCFMFNNYFSYYYFIANNKIYVTKRR